MTPMQTVEAFLDTWHKMDWAAMMDLMADDIFYHNIPMEPLIGKPAVHAFFGSMPPINAMQAVTHFIAANGNVVLTERTDKFDFAGTWVEIRVMGTFEIENGKIQRWRDYFDMAEFQSQMDKLGS